MMSNDRYFENWYSISKDPKQDLSVSDPDERTRPLVNVKKLRDFASQIHILQLRSFSDEDREKEVASLSIAKDQLLQLSGVVREHFELGDFISPEQKAEIFVSTSSTELFLGVVSGARRIIYSFNPKVNFLTIKMEFSKNGDWYTCSEKPLDKYDDPEMILGFFKLKLSVNGSDTA